MTARSFWSKRKSRNFNSKAPGSRGFLLQSFITITIEHKKIINFHQVISEIIDAYAISF